MHQQELDFLVAKLLSGITYFKVDEERYRIIPCTPEQRLLAEHIAMEASDKLSYDQLLSEEDAKEYLQNMGIWTKQDEENYENSEKLLEDLKIKLYKHLFNHKAQKTLRGQISGVKRALFQGLMKSLTIAQMTLEWHRTNIKNQFLTAICIRNSKDEPAYNEGDFWDKDGYIMQKGINAKEADLINASQMREIARTEPWRSYWSVGQENVFGVSASHLGDRQKQIIMYAKMYDNAYQNPECPPDEVIEDDDMFDGWMLSEKKDREKDKKKKNIDKITGQKGDEIFVVADTKVEADEIVGINENSEKMRVRDRLRQVKSADAPVEEMQLKDVKMQLRRQMTEQVKGSRK